MTATTVSHSLSELFPSGLVVLPFWGDIHAMSVISTDERRGIVTVERKDPVTGELVREDWAADKLHRTGIFDD